AICVLVRRFAGRLLLRVAHYWWYRGRWPRDHSGGCRCLRADLHPDVLPDADLCEPGVVLMEENPAGIALKFEHITVSFLENPALDDVSFEVPAGDTRILFGAAGSGKTVTLKTALGLLKPASGRVSVFGQDITNMREKELFTVRSKIGMLFQESALFDSMTAEDNVAY